MEEVVALALPAALHSAPIQRMRAYIQILTNSENAGNSENYGNPLYQFPLPAFAVRARFARGWAELSPSS